MADAVGAVWRQGIVFKDAVDEGLEVHHASSFPATPSPSRWRGIESTDIEGTSRSCRFCHMRHGECHTCPNLR